MKVGRAADPPPKTTSARTAPPVAGFEVEVRAAAPARKTVDAPAPTAAKPAAPAPGGVGFHDILSAMNPLQYVPVVGTIYRSITGDTIPEHTRMMGSLAFSGLTSGPIGIATNLVSTALERLTGFDPERLGRRLLAGLGIGRADPAPAPASAAVGAPPDKVAASEPARAHALTRDEMTAYGIHRDDAGELSRGKVSGADVLNDLELARLTPGGAAGAAYAGIMRPDSRG